MTEPAVSQGTMKIIERRSLGPAAWDALANSSPEGWFWHRYAVCDTTVKDWPGRRDCGFAVMNAQDQVEAIVPAYVFESRTSFGLRVRYQHSMGGPALLDKGGRSKRQQVLDAVAGELHRRAALERVIKTTISTSPMAPALRGSDGPRCNPLLFLGCEDDSGQTWVADLRQGAEAAWKNLEGRARTAVRRAEEAGVTIRRSTSPEDWHSYFELHKTTYQRLGVPCYPAALFRAIFEELIPAGLCDVQFAELGGRPVGANNFICCKQAAYYWHGFTSEAGLQTNALTLLIWSSIKRLAETGEIHWLDCGDAEVHAQGKMRQLSDFKRSFGGDLYPAFRGQLRGTSNLYNRLLHLRGFVTGR